jgi:5'-nucleotidase
MTYTIFVTNDDGVTAPGLLALAQEMRKIGNVLVLAPDRNWSGQGHVKTIGHPLRVREVQLADGSTAFTSDGAPSDCVALALLGYFEKKIDLVVSGINPMPNIGHDVTYSGTVTAAMEAVIGGVPGLAFSLGSKKNHLSLIDYGPAAALARQVVENTLTHSLPNGVLLNVNIPYLPLEKIKGYRITSQGTRVYRDRLNVRVDPRGNPYYWISGDPPTGIPTEGTDYGALASGYVSVTPLQLDLTAYPSQPALRRWEWEEGSPSESASQSQSIYV